jgi:hypothetical protein
LLLDVQIDLSDAAIYRSTSYIQFTCAHLYLDIDGVGIPSSIVYDFVCRSLTLELQPASSSAAKNTRAIKNWFVFMIRISYWLVLLAVGRGVDGDWEQEKIQREV